MTKTSGSRRISSAMASRSASRMVMVTSSVPSGTSGSGMISAGGGVAVPVFAGAGASASFAGSSFGDGRRGFFLRRGPGSRRFAVLQRGSVLALAQDHGDRRIDRDVGGAFRHQDFSERAFVDRLHFHGGFVGLDLGDDVAGFDACRLPS